jgi:hypothetical protein
MPASDETMAAIEVAKKQQLECGFKLRHGRMMRGTPVHVSSEYRKVTIQQSDGSGRTFYLGEIAVYDWPPEVMAALSAMGHFKKLEAPKERRKARGGAHPEDPEAFKSLDEQE